MWGFQKQGDMHEGALNASVPCQRCAKLVAALKAIRECQDLAQARLQARVALEELGE